MCLYTATVIERHIKMFVSSSVGLHKTAQKAFY